MIAWLICWAVNVRKGTVAMARIVAKGSELAKVIRHKALGFPSCTLVPLVVKAFESCEHLTQILKYPRRPHATADAHGHQPVPSIPPLHLADDRCRQLCSRASQRMPQRDRAAIGIHPLRIKP